MIGEAKSIAMTATIENLVNPQLGFKVEKEI